MSKSKNQTSSTDANADEILKLTSEAKELIKALGAKDGDFNLDQNAEGLNSVISTLKDMQAQKELDEEAKAKKDKVPEGAVSLINITPYTHHNPYSNIRFEPGVRVEGIVLDSWTECQCDAGILELID